MSSDRPAISFRNNMAAAFGLVLRSSALFYYRRSHDFTTTICFMNYWKLKRSIDVSIVASTRDLGGKLLLREKITLSPDLVVSYRPKIGLEFVEGSIEIEAFSIENLVIPYAAAMAIYESRDGLSMVHSYARAYSRYEVEEGHMVTQGHEGCWTLRDSANISSFGVFHNGPREVPLQPCRLKVSNIRGETRTMNFELAALAPYQTVVIRPTDHVPNLEEFLAGNIGQASLSFSLGEGFTRMLVGNERKNHTDFQITHSNFDYGEQVTDYLDGKTQVGFMRVPSCGVSGKSVVVYPHSSAGTYSLTHNGVVSTFRSGETLVETVRDDEDMFEFTRTDGLMPTRMVAGVVLPNGSGILENECSLGMVTHLQPRKQFWWGICAADERRGSRLIIHDLPEIYGGMPRDGQINVSLYSTSGHASLTRTLRGNELGTMDRGLDLEDIFPRARDHLNGDFGYYTVFHEYGGLTCYTLVDNRAGSGALEHGF